jgi:hypothetical protein
LTAPPPPRIQASFWRHRFSSPYPWFLPSFVFFLPDRVLLQSLPSSLACSQQPGAVSGKSKNLISLLTVWGRTGGRVSPTPDRHLQCQDVFVLFRDRDGGQRVGMLTRGNALECCHCLWLKMLLFLRIQIVHRLTPWMSVQLRDTVCRGSGGSLDRRAWCQSGVTMSRG